ncbi:MAG: hypothetical protein KQI81_23495, partial [Deltaproteobacteria bacterium]|nr:hypothetical protein [Deltaproteobacteria bacterium]
DVPHADIVEILVAEEVHGSVDNQVFASFTFLFPQFLKRRHVKLLLVSSVWPVVNAKREDVWDSVSYLNDGSGKGKFPHLSVAVQDQVRQDMVIINVARESRLRQAVKALPFRKKSPFASFLRRGKTLRQ